MSKLTFEPSLLATQLSSKQEQLFQALAHFHIIELATHEHTVEEAKILRDERDEGREGETGRNGGGYVEQQQWMLKLKVGIDWKSKQMGISTRACI